MRCLLFYRQLKPSKPIRLPGNTAHNRQQSSFSLHPKNKMAGVTLLELLAVITLLAILATGALVAFDGVDDEARYSLTQFEIEEIRKALLQFRHDSGSKYFPKQGIYDCDDDPDGDSNTPNPELNFPNHISSYSQSEKVDWCKHPANFWMLFENPLTNNDWDPDTKRGWNGPYIRRKDRFLDIELRIPDKLSVSSIVNVWGIADTFETRQYRPDKPGKDRGIYWFDDTVSAIPFELYGNPYLAFELNDPDSARVMSTGPNGINESTGSIDPCDSRGDDIVLCLLR
ncbi:prepilin-type cleavage/methylation domain-containing protein [Methylophaga nitratireducenticrescens]|uniref:Type II secretion system protein n=1 Tax=Methylophaga nitratireducenticrescens TaxID=754476 RepID=I1XJ01_METNJ|nr:type II secretion system protein [Methylophaga nitratireducenticrescens]AFI84370.1 prepilin-type cleavage/methylation domain-containing protein [Methylophaga nitratireducenticrescens]